MEPPKTPKLKKVADKFVEKVGFGHYIARKPHRIYDFKLTDIGEPRPWRSVEADAESGRVIRLDNADTLEQALAIMDRPDPPEKPEG